jgi:hypothetical protein
MKNLYQRLLLLIAGATQLELARHVRYLKIDNEIPRSKLPKRVLVTPKEQNRLVKFGAKLGKALSELVTIVHPDTLRRWIRDSQQKAKENDPLIRASSEPPKKQAEGAETVLTPTGRRADCQDTPRQHSTALSLYFRRTPQLGRWLKPAAKLVLLLAAIDKNDDCTTTSKDRTNLAGTSPQAGRNRRHRRKRFGSTTSSAIPDSVAC